VVIEAVVAEVDMGGALAGDGSGVLGYTGDVAEVADTVCPALYLIGAVPPSPIRTPANQTPAPNKRRSSLNSAIDARVNSPALYKSFRMPRNKGVLCHGESRCSPLGGVRVYGSIHRAVRFKRYGTVRLQLHYWSNAPGPL
jgi:hypothetical protein